MQNENFPSSPRPVGPNQNPNPVPPPQAIYQTQPLPAQPNPIVVGGSPQYEPMAQPSGNKKKLLIVGISLVVLVLITVAILVLPGMLKDKSAKQSSSGGPTPPASLPEASELTGAKVASLNKNDLFWGYFVYAAQQQRVSTVHAEESSPDTSKPSLTLNRLVVVDYDYKTKKFLSAKDFYAAPKSILNTMTRCLAGGEQHLRYPYLKLEALNKDESQWKKQVNPCELSAYSSYLNDGFSVGGLTAAQATKYVEFLQARPGLFSVTGLKLEQHKGKQYLHFSAKTTPIKTTGGAPGEPIYQGNEWLYYGLEEVGIDERTHPYNTKESVGNGFAIEYYVDPAKKLPAYVELVDTPPYDDSGRPLSMKGQVSTKTTIHFGPSKFDFSLKNMDWITLDW